MNGFIIADEILENSYCNECYKYLTVAPIGVHPKGGNICGRCLYGDGHYPPNTLFEYTDFFDDFFPLELFCFASCNKGFFPCINRFDGCDKLLSFHEIRQHEKFCKVPKIQCPFCCYKGVGSQMLQHFKIDHSHKVLCNDRNRFYLNFAENINNVYLYRSSKNILFFVKIKYRLDISQISFDILSLASIFSSACIRLDFLYGKTNKFSLISDNLNVEKDKNYNITMKIDNFEMFEAKNIFCSFNVIFNE